MLLAFVSAWAQEAPTEPVHDDDILEIVVESTSSAPQSTTVLGAKELERSAGDDLGETLADVPGVVAARGSSDATKPVIRGQLERRLLVLFDGVRHEGQKWGTDHATEIDPFAAGAIRVIRGAAGVRYGPDAIGGVVLVDPPPMRSEPGWGGRAGLVGAVNGWRGVGAARVDWVPASAWSMRVEGNYGRGAVVSSPDYPLGNTASETWNLGASVRWSHADRSLLLSVRHYDLRAGVCFCLRSESSDDFVAALSAETPIGADRWTTGFSIERPYQDVGHDLAIARTTTPLGQFGVLTATYAYQFDHRQEFDQVRGSVTGPQYDFRLRTHTVDLVATRHDGPVGAWTTSGGLGAALLFQEHVYSGLTLIPNHRALTAGAFGWEHWSTGPIAVEAGARLDVAARTVFLSPSVFEADVARGVLDEEDCDSTDSAAKCPHRWVAGSLSTGAIWRIVQDTLDLRLDLSSASRFPNPDELYSNGTAPTLPVYAVGDPNLRPETTWGGTPTLRLSLPAVQAQISAFANFTNGFIQFAPERAADGTLLFDVTVRGAFPRFSYQAIDASFHGVDGQMAFRLNRVFTAGIQGATVRGVDRDTGDPLPFVPPDRLRATFGFSSVRRHSFAEIRGDWIGRAIASPADLAPPPDPVLLLGAEIGHDLHIGDRDVSVGLEGSNLLDARYRDPTSLLRYFAHEPGRQFRLRVNATW